MREFSTLSDEERMRWIEIVVYEAGDQVPFIAATSCGHSLPAFELSRHAQQVVAQSLDELITPVRVKLHPNCTKEESLSKR
jgi:dihydrodipicolinate synthase/N-acetylneuraminate lyase